MVETVVNPHTAKLAYLQPNLHCTLEIDRYGTHRWFNAARQLHRVGEDGIQDGPAIIRKNGTLAWVLNDKSHRLDGPAWIEPDGTRHWIVEGKQLSQEEWAVNPPRY